MIQESRSGFVAALPPGLAASLLQKAFVVHYPAGSAIPPGAGSFGLLVVASGCFRTFLAAPDGRQVTLRYQTPGDVVDGLRLRRTAAAASARRVAATRGLEAVTAGSLLHFDPEHLAGLAAREPALAAALVQELSDAFDQALGTVAVLVFGTVRTRVACDLLARASMFGAAEDMAFVPVTQQELADAVGSVREVVARVIRELYEEGVLARARGGLTIVDYARLAAAAELQPVAETRAGPTTGIRRLFRVGGDPAKLRYGAASMPAYPR